MQPKLFEAKPCHRSRLAELRFLVDENLPGVLASALIEHGHDAVWVKMSMPEAPDAAVWAMGATEQRILITRDKGFGKLGFRVSSLHPPGVLLLRLDETDSALIAEAVIAVLDTRAEWVGYFVVVTEGGTRARKFV